MPDRRKVVKYMENYDVLLARALKIKFGTAPSEPTSGQLEAIKREVSQINAPNDSDWARIVAKYCSGFGSCFYGGVDNSHLNTILMMAIQAALNKGK